MSTSLEAINERVAEIEGWLADDREREIDGEIGREGEREDETGKKRH